MLLVLNDSRNFEQNKTSERECADKGCKCTSPCKNCRCVPIVPEHPEIELLGNVLDRVLIDIIKRHKQ